MVSYACYLYSQLSLNDNKLAGNLECVADLCPEVSHIGLAGNKIADVAELKPLVSKLYGVWLRVRLARRGKIAS